MPEKLVDLRSGREFEGNFDQLSAAHVDSESPANVARIHYEGPNRIRLYDCVDGTWTAPLEQGMVFNHYLRKVVYKCSACNFSTVFETGGSSVERHVTGVLERYELHQGAAVEATVFPFSGGSEMGQLCTGCSGQFTSRKQQGTKHLAHVLSLGEAHQGSVRLLVMKQFALEPSESVLLGERLVREDNEPVLVGMAVSNDSEGPEAMVKRSGTKRRRRHRNRNKGKVSV
jgi:hypothetical protein